MARPNLSYLKNLILFVLGIPCGIVTALTGIDTSAVLASLLAFLLGRRIHVGAVALALTFFAALAALLSYQVHHEIRWTLALVLAVGQLAGGGIGQRLVRAAPLLSRLHLLWTILLICGGLVMLGQAVGRPATALHPLIPDYGSNDHTHGAAFFGIAFAVACLVGLLSPVFDLRRVLIVPAALYLLHLSLPVALGTGIVVLLLTALPVLIVYRQTGQLETQSAAWLSGGGLFGGLIGAYLVTQRLPPPLLLACVGIVISILGTAMLWRPSSASSKGREAL